MSNIAIRVDQLSKQYKIGVAKQRHDTLRDAITESLKSIFRSNGHGSAPDLRCSAPSDTIWALKDVSFEVKHGEVIGLIGRNGAGKSTLLKILSRITGPSDGRAEIYGRVGSLLEVGTGFHGELTGRENIYLNGAILGMKKWEIEKKFDKIVAFAEVGKFVDTPVKRYSSGMFVRLAFAVAAHLEPEILIVDEVLAVGDTAFQKKCLGKMSDVAREGRTVLFVSHSMPAIQALCRRIMWIHEGALKQDGHPDAVIPAYLKSGLDMLALDSERPEIDLSNFSRRSHSEEKALRRAWIVDRTGTKNNSIMMGDSLRIYYEFQCSRPIKNPIFGFAIEDEYHRRILTLDNYIAAKENNVLATADTGIACLSVPEVPLLPGKYFVTLSLVEDQCQWIDRAERALVLHVQPADVYNSGRIPESQTQGVVFVTGDVSVQAA
ncbi:MAG: ABC transporter ATP-binding protein [Alphaproteobacteria bacterium]